MHHLQLDIRNLQDSLHNDTVQTVKNLDVQFSVFPRQPLYFQASCSSPVRDSRLRPVSPPTLQEEKDWELHSKIKYISNRPVDLVHIVMTTKR